MGNLHDSIRAVGTKPPRVEDRPPSSALRGQKGTRLTLFVVANRLGHGAHTCAWVSYGTNVLPLIQMRLSPFAFCGIVGW